MNKGDVDTGPTDPYDGHAMTWYGGDEGHEDRHEHQEIRLLREQVRLLREILAKLPSTPQVKLSSIKVILSGGNTMPVGPLTISVGQKYVASVVGFDQNGAPFTGPIPAASFAVADATVASIDPTAGTGAGLAAGVTGVSASLTSAEGLALTDSETLTVTAVVPVLSSIKVSLDPA